MKVNALAAKERGGVLQPFSYDITDLDPNECIVKVTHCGICHSDVHMMDDDWKMSKYPLVPGHEVVGEVVERGAGVTQLKVGTRVGIGWQRTACMQCRECLEGNENLCDHNQGVITHGHGGFGDYLRIDSRFCFPLPDGLASEIAGPLMCGGITVYCALRYAGMHAGQHIGVLGIGGLGHMAVQFAARLGNHVTAFTKSEDKSTFAVKLGAHDTILSPGLGPGRAPKRPLDILISTAAVDLDWPKWIDLLGADGTMVFVGIPPKPLTVHAGQLLEKRRRVMASPIGGRGIMREMLEVADQHGVMPVVEMFPMAEANTAIQKVRDNTVRYRAVLKVG